MSRPASGQLVWQKQGWSARVWRTIDGERVRVRVPLGTTNRVAAQRKLERLIADESAPLSEVQRPETFREAAERVNVQRLADGVATAKDELARLKSYAFPVFENVPAAQIETSHVNAALDFAKAQRKARQTVAHVRQAIRAVFETLKRDGAVKANPCDSAQMPRFAKVATRETAVLEDSELLVYLAYQPPEKRHQLAVLERQTMSCVSRCFGGLRTNDLHKLNWPAAGLRGSRRAGLSCCRCPKCSVPFSAIGGSGTGAPRRARCSLPYAASALVKPKARSATRRPYGGTCAERLASRLGTPNGVSMKWSEH